jgi:hypothetical protein
VIGLVDNPQRSWFREFTPSAGSSRIHEANAIRFTLMPYTGKFGGERRFFGPSQKVDMKGFVIQGVWNDNGSRN